MSRLCWMVLAGWFESKWMSVVSSVLPGQKEWFWVGRPCVCMFSCPSDPGRDVYCAHGVPCCFNCLLPELGLPVCVHCITLPALYHFASITFSGQERQKKYHIECSYWRLRISHHFYYKVIINLVK